LQTKTYEDVMEGLGDRPWRTLDGTEQWFLVDEPEAEPREEELDTAAFRIPRPSSRWWLALGAAAVAGGLCSLLIGSAVATPAPPPPAPPAQIYVVAAPPPPVLAPAPVARPPVALALAQVAPPVAKRAISKPALIKRPLKHRKRAFR
jgi:hypothetical protein